MKTVNFTLYPFTAYSKIKSFTLVLLLITSQFFLSQESQAQCAVGWNTANVNWDNLDYLITTGNYSGFVSNAQRDNQYFALGRNRVNLNVPAAITKLGENTTHTGEAGSYGAGADVAYNGNGTFTMSFDTAVKNVKFSLYDIDANQVAAISAVDPLGVPIIVNMAKIGGSGIVIVGNGTVLATGTAPGGGVATNNTNSVLNIDVAGAAAGVKTITIAISGTAGDFWLGDISACVFGSFPSNYYAEATPFTGQPAYVLATPDSNTVSMLNLNNAVAKHVFRDPASTPYVNGLGYDVHRHNLYFVKDFTATPSTNKTLKKYDFNTETISTVIADITTLGIPVFDRGVESAGSAFYDSCLYFGIEGTNNGRNSNRETIIWRISFDAAGVPNGIAQVFALPADNGSGTILKDWGDFNIYNGILYDFNSGNGGSTAGFFHFNLQTCNIDNTYPTGTALIGRQSGLKYDGTLYWIYDSIAVYTNGTVGPKTKITGAARVDWVGFSGDGSDPFKPKSDFGDAPASYDPVALSPATHEYDSTLRLGLTFDREWSKVPSAGANGDGGDEDGILGPLPIFTHYQSGYSVIVTFLNKSGASATVGGWIDFNNNGVYEASEGVTATVGSASGMQSVTLTWTASTLPIGLTGVYTRIRITSAANGMTAANPTGYYSNGEVEDYLLLVDDVLPVKLIDFAAKSVNSHTVNLDWQTAEESKMKFYTVQRSSDATAWTSIGTISAANDGSLKQQYKLQDKDALAGVSYYRLQMTDLKDNITYSAVRKIDFRKEHPIAQLYPNPFTSSIQVTYQLPAAGMAEIRLVDYSGRTIKSNMVQASAGQQTNTLDGLSNLPKGYYLVEIVQNGKKIFTERVSRQ